MKNGLKTLSILLISFSIIGCATDLQKAESLFIHEQYVDAAVYIEPLANSGDPVAQFYLGQFSQFGLGDVTQDANQAAHWYSLSAESEYPAAMHQLASIYYNSGDVDSSLAWLNRSARWGFTPSAVVLESLSEAVPSADLLWTRGGRVYHSSQYSSSATRMGSFYYNSPTDDKFEYLLNATPTTSVADSQ